MIRFLFKKEQGFSIIEVVIYIALMSMVLFTLVSFIITVLGQQNRIESNNYLDSEARHIFSRLELIIQNASDITNPNPGQSDPSLILIVDDLNKSPTEIYLQDGRIFIDEDGQSYSLTGNNLFVEYLVFKNFSTDLNSDIVQIRMRLSMQLGSNSNQYIITQDYTSSFTLRQYD